MSNQIQPSVFLRRVLMADALVSAVVGVVMALGAAALQGPLGLPNSLLMLAGVALFPYAAYVLWLARRSAVPRAAVWVPIVLNIGWAIECLFIVFGGGASPTLLGEAFIAVQVVTVLVFAELEFVGLSRRSEAPV